VLAVASALLVSRGPSASAGGRRVLDIVLPLLLIF
jgi:hypothetical protein